MRTMAVERSSDENCGNDCKVATRWAALADLRLSNKTRREIVFRKWASSSVVCFCSKQSYWSHNAFDSVVADRAELGAIETHDDLALYHRDGRRHVADFSSSAAAVSSDATFRSAKPLT